jgi:hypothetical protein
VNSVAVTDATHLTANISIALNAAAVAHPVTVTTGAEVVTLANGFTVQSATNQPPVITIAPTWSVTLPSRLTITYTVTDAGGSEKWGHYGRKKGASDVVTQWPAVDAAPDVNRRRFQVGWFSEAFAFSAR